MDKGIHILHLIFAFRYLKQYQPSACGIYKWYLWRGFQWIVVVAPFVFDNGSLSCIGRCQVHVCFIDRFIFFFKNIEILDKMCKWFLRQFYVNNKFCEQTNLSCKTHSGGGGDQEGWSALPLFLVRILEGLSPHSLEGNISSPYSTSLGPLGWI